MHLEGQPGGRTNPEAGYAMAVLLAALAIMGVVWMMVVPVWKQYVQREREAELIFRAGQYARAVALYQRKYANAFPPTVDVLLREKFLRKKYKDPITNGDFRLVSPLELQAMPGMTTTTPGMPGRPGPGGAPIGPTPNLPGPTTPGGLTPGGLPSGDGLPGRSTTGPTGGPTGGIAAAVSRSTAASIRVFKNRRQYNQWIVTVQDVMPRSAVGMQQGLQPGQQPGQMPGMTGQPGGGPFSPTPSMPTGRTP